MSRAVRGTSAREAEDYLVGVYSTCTGFELAVVTSVEPEHRVALRDRLLAEGAMVEVVAPSVEAVVEAPELGAGLEGHRTLVRWIEADEDTDETAWRELAVALNRSRDRLRANHRYLWVLAGPLALRRIMTVHAQDIYSGAYKAPHIIARAGAEIGWVHLSDLQFDRSGSWMSKNSAFLADLRRTLDAEQFVPDLVLISGDLAAHGEPSEYEQVDRFLDELSASLERHGGAAPIVLAVPGNHDVRRPRDFLLKWTFELLRRRRSDASEQLSEWLRDPSVFEPLFAGYLGWARRRMDERLLDDKVGMKPGVCYLRSRLVPNFPGDWSVLVEKDDLRVRFVGVNTAWTSFDDDRAPLLVFPQFEAALGGPELTFLNTAHVAVLLTHHGPWSMSAEGRVCLWQRIHRIDKLAAHVHGHVHDSPADEFGPPMMPGGLPLFGRHIGEVGGYGIARLDADGRVWVRRRFVNTSTSHADVRFSGTSREAPEDEMSFRLGRRWESSLHAELAAWIHGRRGRRWVTESELDDANLPTSDILRALCDRRGELGFTYLGLQEYLTAHHFLLIRNRTPTVIDELAAKFDDSWWQEVILLFIARDADACKQFMHALVRRPEFPEWANTVMMQRCLRILRTGDTVAWWPFVDVLRDHEHFLDAHKFAALRTLEQLGVNPSESRLHRGPAPVRKWWSRRRELPRSERTRLVSPRGRVELMRVPGGSFCMGSPDTELGRRLDEGPPHVVEFDTFYIARTPITNAEYARYLRDNPNARKPRYWHDRRYNQSEQPVVGISWEEAQAYCEWAGLLLPTEAQWEYACRAGTSSRFHSGEDEAALARVGWYAANAGGHPHVVRTLEANALGLFDMHGNVREWCLDDFGSYRTPPRAGDGLRHPPTEIGSRVYRGGSYLDPAEDVRAASRRPILPGYRLESLGFRPVALDPDGSPSAR